MVTASYSYIKVSDHVAPLIKVPPPDRHVWQTEDGGHLNYSKVAATDNNSNIKSMFTLKITLLMVHCTVHHFRFVYILRVSLFHCH